MSSKSDVYLETLNWFVNNKNIYFTNRSEALSTLITKSLQVTGVDRVGIWFFNPERDSLKEELSLMKENRTTSEEIIRKCDYPSYFNQLNQEGILFSSHCFSDNRLIELREKYLKKYQIVSKMDVPIYLDGETIGYVCFEQNDRTRFWDDLDKKFVIGFSDVIGRRMEVEKRHVYEKELRYRIHYLENDLKKKLDDLNEANLSLDLALEGAQVGKWDWNIESGKVSLNKTWYTKLGYSFEELPQSFETFKKIIHPDDQDRVLKEIEECLEGKTFIYESKYRMITKSGDIQWCMDRGRITERATDGAPVRLIGVNFDVTPVLKWEESLIISEQQLKAMIQSLPIPVAMFDRNLKYLAMSSRWPEEWRDFVPLKSSESALSYFLPDWRKRVETALMGEKLMRDEELVDLGDGREIWLSWAMQPWKNAKDEIGGVIVMAENINSKKNAEMRLTHASKLSALGEMAGGIAHEINNPLSVIKGYLDLMRRHSLRKSLGTELLNQYIEKMDQTVFRISRIVNGMRRFARESSMDEKTNYSINKIIEDTLDVCLEKINNNGTALKVEYLKNDSSIYCHPIEISQVILNLVINSFHAIRGIPHPWIKILAQDLGESLRIQVIDCGNKIPSSIQKKLFQPFFTTKDVGVGTGLGLSISRGIVEEHRGKLFYDDSAPQTTFVLELPKPI